MRTRKRREEKLVAVNVTLLIPLSRADVRGTAAEAMKLAGDIVRELPVEVGGVRVRVVG